MARLVLSEQSSTAGTKTLTVLIENIGEIAVIECRCRLCAAPSRGCGPGATATTAVLGDPLMKKEIFACAMSVLLLAITGWADDKEKNEDRLKNAGTVLTEILNIPDDIPQDLLDKADCVVVFPSVLKAAFVVGGSYGRGAITCRTGENFTGPWGAPSMMALEGGSVGFQNRRARD
jgi:hypothetical protein